MCKVKFTKPCNDCPFCRDSAPGWLGAAPPEWFVDSALSDYASYQNGVALSVCHATIDYDDPDWADSQMPEAAACAGALIFCKNNAKSPRQLERGEAVRRVEVDHEGVFSTPQEFIDHHRREGGIRSWEKSNG